MLRQTSVLVSLVVLIERLPWPPEPAQRPRGRPNTDADRLVRTALVIRLIRRLSTASALLPFLDQDDAVAAQLRPLLCEHGGFPSWSVRESTSRIWTCNLAN